jgi:hypothetical protein
LILGYEPFDPNRMERLGSIGINGGLSLHCDEGRVLQEMKEEACALGTDTVNITDEQFPCYSAKADFIRLKNREELALVKPDPHYDPSKIQERQERWSKTQSAIMGDAMGGVIGVMTVPHK